MLATASELLPDRFQVTFKISMVILGPEVPCRDPAGGLQAPSSCLSSLGSPLSESMQHRLAQPIDHLKLRSASLGCARRVVSESEDAVPVQHADAVDHFLPRCLPAGEPFSSSMVIVVVMMAVALRHMVALAVLSILVMIPTQVTTVPVLVT